MADGLNKVMLLGNLGSDPELRITPGGQALLKLRLATTDSYLDKTNTRQERTEWHTITMWGKRGEGLAKLLSKGDKLFVEGALRTNSYEKNGEKRYTTEVIATNILLAGGRRGDNGMGDPSMRSGYEPSPTHRATAPSPFDDHDMSGVGDDDIPF